MVTLILVFLSIFCASIPMVLFLAAIWWLDRYDREPIPLVAATFIWGAGGGVALAIVGSVIGSTVLQLAVGQSSANILSPVVIAPLFEEPTKALVLFLVARSKHFDNTTDGFVYGAAAGLGFGMTENFMYFTQIAMSGSVLAWAQNVFARTFYSAIMHATATAFVGAAIGWSRWRRIEIHLLAIVGGFAVAMGIHALWNGLLVVDQFTWISTAQLNFLLFPLEAATIIGLFLACVWSEKRVIRRHLTAEARAGTLPLQHVPILTSYIRRGKRGWLQPPISQEDYVKTATKLAFRLEQSQTAPAKKRQSYVNEANELRTRLRSMLSG
jgi:RsiW-degrading membrane proteinase PrsW (M82 family)